VPGVSNHLGPYRELRLVELASVLIEFEKQFCCDIFGLRIFPRFCGTMLRLSETPDKFWLSG